MTTRMKRFRRSIRRDWFGLLLVALLLASTYASFAALERETDNRQQALQRERDNRLALRAGSLQGCNGTNDLREVARFIVAQQLALFENVRSLSPEPGPFRNEIDRQIRKYRGVTETIQLIDCEARYEDVR